MYYIEAAFLGGVHPPEPALAVRLPRSTGLGEIGDACLLKQTCHVGLHGVHWRTQTRRSSRSISRETLVEIDRGQAPVSGHVVHSRDSTGASNNLPLRATRAKTRFLSTTFFAAHDERARKNGYEEKMRRIELVVGLYDVVG